MTDSATRQAQDDAAFSLARVQDLRTALILMVAFVLGSVATIVGCQKGSTDNQDSETKTTWQVPTGPTGPEIINQVRQAYATANQYYDQASLHLSYQLEGSYLEEPHAWEVNYDRHAGLKSNIYDARLKADTKQLGCFIFDFGSGNLDDQWQLHPRTESIPIGNLFQDGICRHYLTGQAELPVDQENQLASDMFFPPTIGLLTGQLLPEWLVGGAAQRLADEKIDKRDCHQIQVTHQLLKWTLHIDAENYLIRQIRYPVELLDQRLQNNPEVLHLEMVARFKRATWQPSFVAGTFQLDIPKDAKRVSRFVPVPEPFPSTHVGKRVAALGLRDSGDKPVNQADWDGKVTLLCWTNQAADESALIEKLDKLAGELSTKQYNIARVEVVQNMLPGNAAVAAHLGKLAGQSKVTVLADYGFNAARALGLQHNPIVAVIDREGVLQYVKSLKDNPIETSELSNVLLRIRSGDDVAAEMHSEYEAFLDLYRERLATVSVQSSNGRDDGQLADSDLPQHIILQELWTNSQVQQPGNLRFQQFNNHASLSLLDGWRTVIQLDPDGREQRRQELKLATQESVSVIRSGDRQKDLGVVFSVMGRTVRVLDQNLKTIHTIKVQNEQQRIRDANLFDFDKDGKDELIVSFTGPRGTEIAEFQGENQTRNISGQSFRSSTVIRKSDGTRSMVFCDANANLKFMNSGSAAAGDVESDLIAATRIVSRLDPHGNATICAVGTNKHGHWTAVGLNNDLNQTWSVPIGSQRFETQIESIVYAQATGSRVGIWAIAASDGSIKLIQDDGKLVDNWNVGIPIHGIELIPHEKRYLLILSTESKVQGWSLSSTSGNFMPASLSN